MMRVGHGVAPIEVIDGEPMGGYADRVGGVSGVLEPLTAHAMTIHDGTRRFALIVLDVICVNEDLVREIRESLAVDMCWVSATHTHAGPESGCQPGGARTPRSVRERLRSAAVAAFRTAVADEKQLSARSLRIDVEGLAGTRAASAAEQTAIPIDVMVFSDDTAIRGLLLNVPVHPTVLPASNTLAGPDLVGGIRQSVCTRFDSPGGAPWVMVTTGAAGDISTRNTRNSRSPETIAELGATVADALADALADAHADAHGDAHGASKPIWDIDDTVTVAESSGTLDVPTKSITDLELPSAESASDDALSRNEYTLRQGIELARALLAAGGPAWHRVELSTVAIGPLILVAVPAELFLCLGESIRDRLNPAIVIGYANGYLGYLPDVSSYDAPTYETYASPTRKGSGELIVEEAVRLGRELRRPR